MTGHADRAGRFAPGLLLAACTVLIGCNPSSDHRTVLRFWTMGREGEVVAQLLPEFERLHPQLRVEIEQLPWTAAHEKLLTAFAGDSTPDLCQLGNSWIPEFAALHALRALDAEVAHSATVHAADYFAGIWDTNLMGTTLYGVPWYVDTRALFYRSDLLAAAGYAAVPPTWAEWRRVLEAIRARSGGKGYGVLLPLNEWEPLLALALQQPQPLLDASGAHGNFQNPGFQRALQFYVDLFREQLAPPATNSQIASVWNEFGRGYFAFYLGGPWNISEFRRRLPPALQDAWMTAPLPGPDGPGASIAGGSSLAVFHRSRHPHESWELIEYLSRPDVQSRFHALTGDLPPRRASWTDPGIAGDVYARAFREQLERVKPTPKVPEWERIATQMMLVAERVVRGELTVHDGAVELDARADRILGKRRELLARGAIP